MKIILSITLFFICAALIAFTELIPQNERAVTTEQKIDFDKHFTKYNADFEKRGIIKSSFRHEVK